jgi:D-alanyl-lipoteichoic acid acyltransferase DltB (MBOAT superfamily)
VTGSFGALIFYVLLLAAWVAWAFAPARWRPHTLAAASLVFVLALSQPLVLAALGLLTFVVWAAGRRTLSRGNAWAGAGIAASVAVLLAVRAAMALGTERAWVSTFGVSYFTLQAISYLADLSLAMQAEAASLLDLWLYLAWFPKFAQGPFERFGNFQEQVRRSAAGPRAQDLRVGLLLFAWGLFEKMVVAERLAALSQGAFGADHGGSGPRLWGAAYVFAVRLFADSAGYNDMARGASLLFGLGLTKNFTAPFLATSVTDFWQRWHISLSQWVRDYVFSPLQILWRAWPTAGTVAAMFLAFIGVGLWHGIGWGYLLMGFFYGLCMATALLTRGWRKKFWKSLGLEKSLIRRVFDVVVTFHLICLSFLFFQAADREGLIAQFQASSKGWGASWPAQFRAGLTGGVGMTDLIVAWASVAALLGVFLAGQRVELLKASPWIRYPAYAALALVLIFFGRYFTAQGFLYARF